jgi:Tol biopolymer transport system component
MTIAYPGHDWQFQDALRLVHINEKGISSFQDIEFEEESRIYNLQWSPDGSQLLMLTAHHTSGYSIDIYNLTTGKITTILNPNKIAVTVSATWSPTDDQIASVTRDNRNLSVMNADGTNIFQIPPLPTDAKGAEMVAPHYIITEVYWVP